MSEPRLILHMGHPKTGSSALQSAFALSTEALRREGIVYPKPVPDAAARAGRITSGNFNPARVVDRFDTAVARNPSAGKILFSNEACFRIYLADPAPLVTLQARGVGIDAILFLRDPLTLAVSIYGQMLKRGGGTAEFDRFLARFDFLAQVERFLGSMREAGVRTTLRNYSRCTDRILPVTEEVLGVPAGTLTPAPVERINRSLTRAEMDLMRRLNAALPAGQAAQVADALCDDLPFIAAEMPTLSRPAYEAFATRIAPLLDRLNAQLPEAEHYRMEPYDARFEAASAPPALSEAQQAVVDRALRSAASPAGRAQAIATAAQRSPALAPLRRLARRLLRR